MLIERGHPDAPFYPLGRVADEVAMVTARDNRRIVSEVTLIQQAAITVLGGKEAFESFQKSIEGLPARVVPHGTQDEEVKKLPPLIPPGKRRPKKGKDWDDTPGR